MKGKLIKDEINWYIEYYEKLYSNQYKYFNTIPLHPNQSEPHLSKVNKEVEFEIVYENLDTGALEAPHIKVQFAKLI